MDSRRCLRQPLNTTRAARTATDQPSPTRAGTDRVQLKQDVLPLCSVQLPLNLHHHSLIIWLSCSCNCFSRYIAADALAFALLPLLVRFDAIFAPNRSCCEIESNVVNYYYRRDSHLLAGGCWLFAPLAAVINDYFFMANQFLCSFNCSLMGGRVGVDFVFFCSYLHRSRRCRSYINTTPAVSQLLCTTTTRVVIRVVGTRY